MITLFVPHLTMLSLAEKYHEYKNRTKTEFIELSDFKQLRETRSFSVVTSDKTRRIKEVHTYSESHAYDLQALAKKQDLRTWEILRELEKMPEIQRVTVVVELLAGLSPHAAEYCKTKTDP